jgi:hypothetical protein
MWVMLLLFTMGPISGTMTMDFPDKATCEDFTAGFVVTMQDSPLTITEATCSSKKEGA